MTRTARAARYAAGPLLAALAAVGADPSPPPLPNPQVPAVGAVIDRSLRDPRIAESSGLALSPTHDGLIWTVNDSGNPPVVHGVGADGRTRVRLRLAGVPNLDWEAVAAWRDGDGRALIAVGDIGDNGAVRDGIEIDVFAEPARLPALRGDGADDVPEVDVRPLRRIRLRYPDQPKDAESLVVDPRTQRLYVIAKGLLRARVYLVPQNAWPGGATDRATLTFIGGLGLPLATDAAALPSGHVVVRNYASAMLIGPLPTGQRPLAPLATIGLPRQAQGEGLAVTGELLYLSSEGRGSAVLRLDMPEAFRSAISGAATAGAASGASPTGSLPLPGSSSGSVGPGADGGDDDAWGSVRGGLLWVIGALGVAAVVRFAAVRVSRAEPPRSRRSG